MKAGEGGRTFFGCFRGDLIRVFPCRILKARWLVADARDQVSDNGALFRRW